MLSENNQFVPLIVQTTKGWNSSMLNFRSFTITWTLFRNILDFQRFIYSNLSIWTVLPVYVHLPVKDTPNWFFNSYRNLVWMNKKNKIMYPLFYEPRSNMVNMFWQENSRHYWWQFQTCYVKLPHLPEQCLTISFCIWTPSIFNSSSSTFYSLFITILHNHFVCYMVK